MSAATATTGRGSDVSVAADRKPRLDVRAIANLSFGFFGIQVAFALQAANISRIFQTLGATIDDLPILWIAGPVTGLLVQPIVGYLSDRTWCRFGRRRPYFFAGAVASTLALIVLPSASLLWLAVISFWVLDVAINVSMEPFRAFVGDMLPQGQRTAGYAVQTIFIGLGALSASAAPYLLTHYAGVSGTAPAGTVPDAVRLAFYIGAGALLGAVLWTITSTREYSPSQLAEFAGHTVAPATTLGARRGVFAPVAELFADVIAMPPVMRYLALIQFFSWCGLFVMWIYSTPVVAEHQFGGARPGSPAYNAAGDWVGVLFATYNGVAAAYALLLPALAARIGQARTHSVSLVAGAFGLAGFCVTRDPQMLLLSMVGIGMAWASVLTMPYALLCGAVPYRKFGTYMGIFNFFIVLPQLVVSSLMGVMVRHLFPHDPTGVMGIAAGCLVIAAGLSWRRRLG